MIARLTQLIREIARTEETAGTMASNPQSRKRKDIFGIPMMRRSGVRFTAS
jgi:hypothetical protein